MNPQRIVYILCVLLIAVACKKNNSDEQNNSTPSPLITEKGVVDGAMVTKTIGSGGGELTSADGQVRLTVPAGAVAANTEFAIQPITNTLNKSDARRKAYRLLPEGNSFAKPVRISFGYTTANWNGSTEDLLTVMYQKGDGSWTRVPASLNKVAKTLEIVTTHFSDWLVGTAFEIDGESLVAAGQSTNLHVYGIYDNDDLNMLAPLDPHNWSGQVTSVSNWRIVSGPGHLGPVTGNENGPVIYQQKYSAPATVTSVQKAEIAVTVKGNIIIPDSSAPGGKRTFQEVTLLKEITIHPPSFMVGTFGSRDINYTNVLYTAGQGFAITGKSGQEEISITIDALPGVGSFPSGDFIIADGNSKTVLAFPGGPLGTMAYFSEYATCDPTTPFRYSGTVRITEFGQMGQRVKGSFQGNLYRMLPGSGGCPQYENIPLTITFSTIRTM